VRDRASHAHLIRAHGPARRINSFYDPGLPPFVLSMGDFLAECFKRTTRPALLGAVMRGTNAKFEADTQRMMDVTRSRAFFSASLLGEES
jgi:hypothetical protein